MADVVERPRSSATESKIVQVEIESGETPWATIYLADGNKLRIQLTIAGVQRDDGAQDANGMPGYIVHAGFHTTAFKR